MDHHTTNNYRPSQRAMKALQMIQNKSNQSTNTSLSTKITSRQSTWPPRPPLSYNLDPSISFNNNDVQNSDHLSNYNNSNASLVQTIKPISHHLHNFSPISNKVDRLYSSPEASIPANGNYKKENDSMGIQQSSYITDDRTTITEDKGTLFTEIVEECEELIDHNNAFKSMCFSLNDGKITSLVLTPDGIYCVAGFSTGSIRLFDLTSDGNIDPEDRFGYQIGFIDSSRGSVHVQLELGYSKQYGFTSCHLFAGACQGSTTMLAIDIGSLRDVHKKRGFITVAGGGVKVFQHSDARLKGLTSLNTIENLLPINQKTTRSIRFGYSAVYHLITGKGFGSFHIWEITLEAKSIQTALNSPLGTINNNVDGLVIDGLSYSSDWKHLYQGSINGPTMNFAHFVNINHTEISSTETISLWTENNALNKITNNTIGNNIIPSKSTLTHSSSLLLLVSDFQKDLRPILLNKNEDSNADTYIPVSNNKSKLKDTLWTYAASNDGMILFGGKYDLIVTFLVPTFINSNNETYIVSDNHSNHITTNNSDPLQLANVVMDEGMIHNKASPATVTTPRIFSKVTFSLVDFITGAISSKSSKKGSRHLREISNIWCTSDGAYAVILCSDNAVLLYSVCDITRKGSFPIHIEGDSVYKSSASIPMNSSNSNNNNSYIHSKSSSNVNTGGGFLTYLFEATSCINIDLGISYIHKGYNSCNEQTTYCDCCVSLSAALSCFKDRNISSHKPPEDVIISIGWWLTENPLQGGVLKVCRLKSSIDSNELSEKFEQLFPTNIITSSLVLHDLTMSSNRTNKNRNNNSNKIKNKAYCFLCNDMLIKHWNDSDINTQEKTLSNLIQTSLVENNLNLKHSNNINMNMNSNDYLIPHSSSTAISTSSLQSTIYNIDKTIYSANYIDKNEKQVKNKKKDHKKEYMEQHNINQYMNELNQQDLEIHYPKKSKFLHHGSDNHRKSSIIVSNTIEVNMINDLKHKENKNNSNEIINLYSNIDENSKDMLELETIALQDSSIKESFCCREDLNITSLINNPPAILLREPSIPLDNELLLSQNNHCSNPDLIKLNDIIPNNDDTNSNCINDHYIDDKNNNIIDNNILNNTNTSSNKLLIQEIERLKLDNKRLRIDIDVSMRKADRRFAVELDSRRYWKKEKEELESKIMQLQHNEQYLISKFESSKKLSELIQSVLTSSSDILVKAFESSVHSELLLSNTNINQYNENFNHNNNNTSSFMSPKTNLIEELKVITNYHTDNKSINTSFNYNNNNGIKPFFCTICFDHTANVAITPCGHVCLCTSHAIELQTICNNQMRPIKCPLCKVIAINFLPLQGIEPITTRLS